MIDLVTFLLAQFGLAYIVGHSEISLPLRYLLSPPVPSEDDDNVTKLPARESVLDLRRGILGAPGRWFVRLLECPACLGFWTGGVSALSLGLALTSRTGAVDRFVFAGFVVAGSNFILGRITRLI